MAEQYILGTWFKMEVPVIPWKLGRYENRVQQIDRRIVSFWESNLTSFLGCGIFAFDAGAWENDLAKMMQVSRIHDIMECKNFLWKKVNHEFKRLHCKHWKLSTRRNYLPWYQPLMADGNAYSYAIREIVQYATDKKIDMIVGPEARGFIVGCPVALSWELDLRLFVSLVNCHVKLFLLTTKRIRCGYPLHARRCHQTRPTRPHRWWPLATGGTVKATIEMIENSVGSLQGVPSWSSWMNWKVAKRSAITTTKFWCITDIV